MRIGASGRETLNYKLAFVSKDEQSEEKPVRSAEIQTIDSEVEHVAYKDTIDSYNDADPNHPIASGMLNQHITLEQALEATSQHFDRRIKAMKSARMQEGIGPAFSVVATGAGLAAGAVIAVAETSTAFACGAYSWWVCNREVNLLKKDKAEFERARNHIEKKILPANISDEKKHKLIAEVLNMVGIQMAGVKIKNDLTVEHKSLHEDVKPLESKRHIRTPLDMSEMYRDYDPALTEEKKSTFEQLKDGVKEATNDSMGVFKYPHFLYPHDRTRDVGAIKWARDVSGAVRNANALANHVWLNVGCKIQRAVDHASIKVSDIPYKARYAIDYDVPELSYKAKFAIKNALRGQFVSYAEPAAQTTPKPSVEVNAVADKHDHRLAERAKAEWQGFAYSLSAASADITLGVMEAGQAMAALNNAREQDGGEQALMLLKAFSHGAATFYSIDAPRALARRSSDHANNICSPTVQRAIAHVKEDEVRDQYFQPQPQPEPVAA